MYSSDKEFGHIDQSPEQQAFEKLLTQYKVDLALVRLLAALWPRLLRSTAERHHPLTTTTTTAAATTTTTTTAATTTTIAATATATTSTTVTTPSPATTTTRHHRNHHRTCRRRRRTTTTTTVPKKVGHQHCYERIHPLVNGTVTDRPTKGPDGHDVYASPKAPLYVVIGSAGAMQASLYGHIASQRQPRKPPFWLVAAALPVCGCVPLAFLLSTDNGRRPVANSDDCASPLLRLPRNNATQQRTQTNNRWNNGSTRSLTGAPSASPMAVVISTQTPTATAACAYVLVIRTAAPTTGAWEACIAYFVDWTREVWVCVARNGRGVFASVATHRLTRCPKKLSPPLPAHVLACVRTHC